MERTLSDYEKIKKAEEIYNRRRMQDIGGVRVVSPSSNKNPKKELNSIKRMVLQIFICIILYIIVYLVQNSNYIFSQQFISKTKEILTYDLNFSEYITNTVKKFQEDFNWLNNFFYKDLENAKENILPPGNVSNEINNTVNEAPGVRRKFRSCE